MKLRYIRPTFVETQLKGVEETEGQTIEDKILQILENKEPLDDSVELHYTERKDGVNPDFDIRTDKWEIATDAMERETFKQRKEREDRIKKKEDARQEAASKGQSGQEGAGTGGSGQES